MAFPVDDAGEPRGESGSPLRHDDSTCGLGAFCDVPYLPLSGDIEVRAGAKLLVCRSVRICHGHASPRRDLAGSRSAEKIAKVLEKVELGHLVGHLDEERPWYMSCQEERSSGWRLREPCSIVRISICRFENSKGSASVECIVRISICKPLARIANTDGERHETLTYRYAGNCCLARLRRGRRDTHTRAMKEQAVTVGGAPMYPSKNIIQNAVNSTDTQHGWRISNADRV